MPELDLSKLQVKYIGEAMLTGPAFPRHYTLTHSDWTGDLFLSIGTYYDRAAISGWYTRLMRDEVLAEFRLDSEFPELHLHCHVSGGIVLGPAGWRYGMFRYHLRGVLQAFRYGDDAFFQANPLFGQAPIQVYFNAHKQRYNKVENWGNLNDYKINPGSPDTMVGS